MGWNKIELNVFLLVSISALFSDGCFMHKKNEGK